MSNYDELKKAAESAENDRQTFYDGPMDISDQLQKLAYAAEPATILALLAEREKLLKVVEAAKRYRKFISELQDTTISAEEGDCLDALRYALKELEK